MGLSRLEEDKNKIKIKNAYIAAGTERYATPLKGEGCLDINIITSGHRVVFSSQTMPSVIHRPYLYGSIVCEHWLNFSSFGLQLKFRDRFKQIHKTAYKECKGTHELIIYM